MRKLLFCIFLSSVVCQGIYDIPIVNVNNPVFDLATYGPDYNFPAMAPIQFQLRFPDKYDNIGPRTTVLYALHRPLPSSAGPLNDQELDALKKEYPNVTGDWEHFNLLNATLLAFPIFGSAWDITRIYGIRRIVIKGDLFSEKKYKRAYDTGIDYFDEYNTFRDCLTVHPFPKPYTPYVIKESSMVFDDLLHDIDGKLHYVRFNTVCNYPRSYYCQDYDDAVDDFQAKSVDALSDVTLRCANCDKKTILIKEWRFFDLCVTENRLMTNMYPEFQMRLQRLGFTEEFLQKVVTREQKLALRMFSQPHLRDWRDTFQNYTHEEQDILQHKERQLWKQKYLGTYRDNKFIRWEPRVRWDHSFH